MRKGLTEEKKRAKICSTPDFRKNQNLDYSRSLILTFENQNLESVKFLINMKIRSTPDFNHPFTKSENLEYSIFSILHLENENLE